MSRLRRTIRPGSVRDMSDIPSTTDTAPGAGLQKCAFCGEKSVYPPDEGGLSHAHRGCYMDYCQSLADDHTIVEGERIPHEKW